MTIRLPKPIADYFAADQVVDASATVDCFTPAAIVHDEGHTHAGRDAIRRWKDESSAKYTYTAEPISIASDGRQTVVNSHLVGDFPGSPVDLRYFFVLEDDKIAELEVVP